MRLRVSKIKWIMVVLALTVCITLMDGYVTDAKKDKSMEVASLLYGTWSESTSGFEEKDETWAEVITEKNLIGSKYTVTEIKKLVNGNIVVYWETEFMKAKAEFTADSGYTYGEAMYYVEEDEDYTGDKLYMKKINR